jgi:hypothetical protein
MMRQTCNPSTPGRQKQECRDSLGYIQGDPVSKKRSKFKKSVRLSGERKGEAG